MLYYLFVLHWLGDFVFQSNWMAMNKHKNNNALFVHVFVYCMTFFVGLAWLSTKQILVFVVPLGITHLVQDAITSSISHYYYKNKEIRKFWIVIGFDQILHTLTIIALNNLL